MESDIIIKIEVRFKGGSKLSDRIEFNVKNPMSAEQFQLIQGTLKRVKKEWKELDTFGS